MHIPFLVFALLFAAMNVRAATLHSCPAALPASGAHEVLLTRPDGSRYKLFASEEARIDGCSSVALPVPLAELVSLKPLAPDAAMGAAVILHGPPGENGFSIDSVTGSGAPSSAGPQPVPLRENLLPMMQVRAFGAEERVKASVSGGRLTLQCAPGSKPAGIILGGAWHLPRAKLALHLAGVGGHGRHELQVLDAAALASERALKLGDFSTGDGLERRFALPDQGFDRSTWRAFSIACPREQSSLTLETLQLLPQAAAQRASRSGWVWRPAAWREQAEDVFAHAQRYAIRTLFISVPVQAGAVVQPERLAAFVHAASKRGIAVWTVDGDPQMVLPQEHAAGAARVRAYVDYNNGVEPAARLGGMQFDVEHYLLPGYELAAADWDRRYVEMARALHEAAAGLPLEFVVPFWWADKSALLQAAASYAAGLTVMDYRTRADEILRFAQPFLDWGVARRKQVRIALEAGPVAPEQQRRYARADSGQLWLLTLEQPLLLLLKQARPNPHGPAFRQISATLLDGSATSFHADPARMLALLPQLEQELSAWESFHGMALHELK